MNKMASTMRWNCMPSYTVVVMKVSTLSLRKEVGVDGNLPNHGHDRSGVEIRLLFRKREREREKGILIVSQIDSLPP